MCHALAISTQLFSSLQWLPWKPGKLATPPFFFFKYGIIIFHFILSFFCCLAFPSVIILNECGVWHLCNEKSKLFAWFLSSETNFGNYKRFSNSGELAVSNGLLWQTHWWPINCSQNEIEPLTVLLTASQIRFIFTVLFTIYIV